MNSSSKKIDNDGENQFSPLSSPRHSEFGGALSEIRTVVSEQIEADVFSLKKNLEDLRNHVKVIKAEQKTNTAELKTTKYVEEKVRKLEASIEKLKEKIKAQGSQVQPAAENGLKQEIKDLYSSWVRELGEYKQKIEQKHAQDIRDMTEEMRKFKAEIESNHEKSLLQLKDSLLSQIEELKVSIKPQKVKDSQDIVVENVTMKAEFEEVRAEIMQIKAKQNSDVWNACMNEMKDMINNKTATLATGAQTYEKEISYLRRDNEVIKAELKEVKSSIKTQIAGQAQNLVAENRTLKGELEELKAEIRQIKARQNSDVLNVKMNEIKEMAATTIQAHQTEIQNLKRSNDSLKAELKENDLNNKRIFTDLERSQKNIEKNVLDSVMVHVRNTMQNDATNLSKFEGKLKNLHKAVGAIVVSLLNFHVTSGSYSHGAFISYWGNNRQDYRPILEFDQYLVGTDQQTNIDNTNASINYTKSEIAKIDEQIAAFGQLSRTGVNISNDPNYAYINQKRSQLLSEIQRLTEQIDKQKKYPEERIRTHPWATYFAKLLSW